MAGKYMDYQCQDCLERFGCRQFGKHVIQNSKRQKKSRLVCKTFWAKQTWLRCSKCKEAYDDKCWTRIERMNHRSLRLQAQLVCSACRELGFRPGNLEAYACHLCSNKFGAKMFKKEQRRKYKKNSSTLLLCMQCIAEAEKAEHQCEECLEPIDYRRFEKHLQLNAGQEKSSRIRER